MKTFFGSKANTGISSDAKQGPMSKAQANRLSLDYAISNSDYLDITIKSEESLEERIKDLAAVEELKDMFLNDILKDTQAEYSKLYAASYAISLAIKHKLESVYTPYGDEVNLQDVLLWLDEKMDMVTKLEEVTCDPTEWVKNSKLEVKVPIVDENSPAYYDQLTAYMQKRKVDDAEIAAQAPKIHYVEGSSEDDED